MMQRPLTEFPRLEKIKGEPFEGRTKEIPEDFKTSTKKIEPVFIRIDKFEESLKIFEKTKSKISEIEKMLKHISSVKESEDRELESWQSEIEMIKKQIEKVDKNIFSKI